MIKLRYAMPLSPDRLILSNMTMVIQLELLVIRQHNITKKF